MSAYEVWLIAFIGVNVGMLVSAGAMAWQIERARRLVRCGCSSCSFGSDARRESKR